jgi:hypothetical protein
MENLNRSEIENVSGGFIPLVALGFGAFTGIGGNWVSNTVSSPQFNFNDATTWYSSFKSSVPSWQSAIYSGSIGALTGGLTGSLIGAAGGGLIGNLSQRPGMFALNWGLQQSNPWLGNTWNW